MNSPEVLGVDVDQETRCAHYHGERDLLAIKFKCCGQWFSCYDCHVALADHAATVWLREEFETRALLCGGCGYQMTITEYLACESICPRCRRSFNPGCARHYHLYFATAAN